MQGKMIGYKLTYRLTCDRIGKKYKSDIRRHNEKLAYSAARKIELEASRTL